MHSQGWTCIRSSVRLDTLSISACPRPGPILHPCLLVYRPYVSVSSPLQWGISFLGHPTPSRLTAWSSAPALPERALDGFSRSVHPFFVALGRYYTPCPTYRMETIYGCIKWPNGNKSLLGPACQPFGRFIVTMLTYLRRKSCP